jgi:hypothetical protein
MVFLLQVSEDKLIVLTKIAQRIETTQRMKAIFISWVVSTRWRL